MATSTFIVLEKYQPELIARARLRREQGMSLDEVARLLTEESGVYIGREVLRRYLRRAAGLPPKVRSET